MTQKLTAQIAAAYFGCKVKVPHGESFVIGKMESVTERAIYFYQKEDVWSMGIPACQLILTRLEDITDEHANKVAKIIYAINVEDISDRAFSVKRVEGAIETENEDMDMSLIISSEGGFVFYDNSVIAYSDVSECAIPVINQSAAIDYLRSQNYDLGYGSIPSLIAAGIAVDAKAVNQ